MVNPKTALYLQLFYAIPAYHKHYEEVVSLLHQQLDDDVYRVERQYI